MRGRSATAVEKARPPPRPEVHAMQGRAIARQPRRRRTGYAARTRPTGRATYSSWNSGLTDSSLWVRRIASASSGATDTTSSVGGRRSGGR